MKLLLVSIAVIFCAIQFSEATVTTASGTACPKTFASGDLIFEDNFDHLDHGKWRHEQSMWGGGNNEFQWYVNDRANSFTFNGNVHLRPTLTTDVMSEHDLYNGRIVIPPEQCTNSYNWGCDRTAGNGQILPPVRSAKITTWNSFSFKYGTLEIRAKNPAGDWIWPALWLMPRHSVYGDWPRSGEIDLMELRANRNLASNGGQVGVQQTGATLHFGPSPDQNGWHTSHQTRNQYPGWDANFHRYKMVWTPNDLQFYIDDQHLATFGGNWWQRGGFHGNNPWPNPMAPFDQEFFIQMNNAVGGTMFFPDSFVNGPEPKPWSDASPYAMRQFWEGRSQWIATWNMFNDDRDLMIDYVRVWAL